MGIEQNLKKLGNLQQEINILEKRKTEALREIEATSKITLKLRQDADKEIAKQKEDFEIYKHEVEANHKEIEERLTKRERTLQIQEKEARNLDDEIQSFNAKKSSFSATQKELQTLKSNYLDREQKANLLIQQYEKKISELTKAKEDVERIRIELVEDKKKQGRDLLNHRKELEEEFSKREEKRNEKAKKILEDRDLLEKEKRNVRDREKLVEEKEGELTEREDQLRMKLEKLGEIPKKK